MSDTDVLADFEAQVDALEISLGQTATVAASFDTELRSMRQALSDTGKDVKTLERGLSKGLRRAFDDVVFDGAKLSDALSDMARSMMNTAYNAAMKPVTDQISGTIASGIGTLMQGILPFQNGGSFSQGRVMPFANGGVVSGPVSFPMRGGMGLMGEAGPEAIMPLTRGADGKLGVRAAGGAAPVNVVMNIQTPDAESFRRSQGQMAAQMGRVLGRGQRNR
ncbi:phage tail tape measure protein [Shimia thalassica]|uniref:phage tail tape measure protein n=1 Tax=Shimia thalassica TaxID=1715693 RepID=UPI000C06F4D6|nr:phage tail tape measure protein [Shimia thalassica]PHO04031.1 phage tail protein [Rhodobacteraceae bacterium 4F10]MBU2941476.1 phage tail tape measure protein [Shimia thalassica]MDO6478077.1 phage tail tape measure protein [Shimia thalassica]MDO6504143.1 phage tail tape measure protein [Shimia thalassica]MDO6799150.1 phage tail tape measure protein [Shimia thalassica]